MAFEENSISLKEALKPEKPVEYTPEELEVAKVGILPERAKIIIDGWNKKHKDKPKNVIYHGQITKGFWEYALECLWQSELLKIDIEALPEELGDMALNILQMNADTLRENEASKELQEQCTLLEQENNKLYMQIQKLQEERDKYNDERNELAKKLEETLIKTKKVKNSVEVMEYNQQTYSLCKELITIFRKHNLEENISDENFELAKRILEEID